MQMVGFSRELLLGISLGFLADAAQAQDARPSAAQPNAALSTAALSTASWSTAPWQTPAWSPPAWPIATPPAAGQSVVPEFTSGVGLSQIYDDNIYAARTAKISDWITEVSPYANLRLTGDKGQVNVGGRADLGYFAQHPTEDYNDVRLYTDGRYNYSPILTFTGGTGFDHLHELRSSPNARPGVTPTIYDVTRAFGGALLSPNDNSIRIGGTFDHFNYDNVARIGGGTIFNDDRDRDVATAGVRFGHRLDASDEVFGMFSVDNRQYLLPVDDFGYAKSSNGIRYSAGFRHQIASNIDGEVYGGGIYQHYEDPRFGNVIAPDFGGQVRWTAVPGTTVTANLDRTLQETDIEASSGYLETAAVLRILHWIRPDLRVEVSASYFLDQFNAISRTDQVYSYAIGLRRFLTPQFYIGADFARTTRDSTDLDFSYTESRAMVRAGLIQKPAYTDADFNAPDVPKTVDGRFYIGVQTGIGNLGTKLFGTRGSSGTLQADFGDENWSNGIFAGGGLYIGNWYVGLEADGSKAEGGWNHTHVPAERIFSVSRDYEYGLSAVIGRSLAGGSMIYGKGGVVGARFDTNYQLNARGTDQQQTESGIRVGIGASMPISQNLAVRIEHTYSAFSSYNITCCIAPAGGSPDNFTNDEILNSIGLSYTFGGVPAPVKSANINYGGFYLGAQVGQNGLSTWTTGPRENATTLTANFGDLGYTAGLFGGYGLQIRSFYVGGEIEAELGKTHGDHEREGGGQSIAVDRQWSYGASMRVGYVVNDTALLYARAGVVGTRFQADFVRGNNGLSAQYDETGIRFGGGMELPVSERLIARFDYSHTTYPEFSMSVPPDGAINRFRPEEDLFRIGMLYKFAAR